MEPTLTSDLESAFKTLTDEQQITSLCDDYARGNQSDPYSPDMYAQEYRELVDRAKTNVIRLPPAVLAQVSSVSGYMRVEDYDDEGNATTVPFPSEWKHWRRLRMPVLEPILYNAAATYGQAFAEVRVGDDGSPKVNVLSSLSTVALWDNPVSDEFPRTVVELHKAAQDDVPGEATGWDAVARYDLRTNKDGEWYVHEEFPHDFGVTPVVRYFMFMDTEGRVTGMTEHLIPYQDRINQTVLDLLTAQAYTGHQVVTISGADSEPVRDSSGHVVVDAEGNPLKKPVQVSPKRVLTSPEKDTKFGTLPAASMDGILSALGNALEQYAVAGQMSPYIFHGSIVNISADALAAVDAQFDRIVDYVHSVWGESNCSLLRLVSKALGDDAGFTAWDSKLRWADKKIKTFSAYADGLSKVADSLGIPKRGLWPMVPGVQSTDIQRWEELAENDEALGVAPDDPSLWSSEVDITRNGSSAPEDAAVAA